MSDHEDVGQAYWMESLPDEFVVNKTTEEVEIWEVIAPEEATEAGDKKKYKDVRATCKKPVLVPVNPRARVKCISARSSDRKNPGRAYIRCLPKCGTYTYIPVTKSSS